VKRQESTTITLRSSGNVKIFQVRQISDELATKLSSSRAKDLPYILQTVIQRHWSDTKRRKESETGHGGKSRNGGFLPSEIEKEIEILESRHSQLRRKTHAVSL
jgi:hypothetical protein